MSTAPPEPSPVPGSRPVSGARSTRDAATDALEQAAAAVDPLEEIADFTPLDRGRRLLLVHAHPDDEALSTGATMARYAEEGVLVALVTCTRGEQGEVVPDELAALRGDGEALARHRVEELAAACEALRCVDHRFLGGPGRFVDSGMRETPEGLVPTSDDPRALARATLDRDGEAVAELVAVLREVRPQVVVGYGADGGYGHPDHVAAHHLLVTAVAAAADPAYRPGQGVPWTVSKRYEVAWSRVAVAEALEDLRTSGAGTGFAVPAGPEQVGHMTPEDRITTEVDAGPWVDAKLAALRAHRTQVAVDGPFYALSHGRGLRVPDAEHFVLAAGVPGPGHGPGGREDDLFAGVDT